MNTLDILILLVVVLSIWRGFQLGLIRSVVSVVGWFVALYVGTHFAKPMSPFFVDWVSTPALQTAVAFVVLVLGVFVLARVVAALLVSMMQALALRPVERLAGAVFGALKGGLIVLVLVSVLAPWLKTAAWWQQSHLVPELMPYAPLAMQVSRQLAEQAWQQLNSSPDL
ncbi:MAG: CvpA family protein [Pseudomonadota bacterium]|nr:CvpA family protein [Pseudomonadota bacterium]